MNFYVLEPSFALSGSVFEWTLEYILWGGKNKYSLYNSFYIITEASTKIINLLEKDDFGIVPAMNYLSPLLNTEYKIYMKGRWIGKSRTW